MVWSRLMAFCRKIFWRSSIDSTRHSAGEPLEPIVPTEPITRFIHYSSYYTESTGRVKAAAIAPARNTQANRLETSVYRASEATSAELWDICGAFVDDPARERVMRARATCTAEAALATGLLIDADGKPHVRHANLVNWPTAKDEQKNIQQKIAARMTLELRPVP